MTYQSPGLARRSFLSAVGGVELLFGSFRRLSRGLELGSGDRLVNDLVDHIDGGLARGRIAFGGCHGSQFLSQRLEDL